MLGILGLGTRRGPRRFTREERELLGAVSDQAAVAIENAQLYAETSRRVDEIETLFAVQQAITSRLDLATVLQLIADEARRLTSSRVAVVFMLDGDELCVSVLSSEGKVNVPIGYRMPITHSITAEALRKGQALWIDHIEDEPRAYPDLVKRLEVHSLMVLPLMSGLRPIGSISLVDKLSGKFNTNDERVLNMLASSAVIGLENARLYQEQQARREEAERRHQIAESLRDILTVLNSSRPLEEILSHIVAQADRLLGADAGAIYRLQSKEGPLRVQAAQGLPEAYITSMEIPVGEALVGRAVLDRQPVAVPDVAKITPLNVDTLQLDPQRWPLVLEVMAQYHALLAVPLIIKNEVYGGIVLYYSSAREFSEEEIGLAVSFADQVALAIENARLFDQAEQAAILEERQRLARELHDSVTQALYGVTMFAEAATRLLTAGKIELAADHLSELRSTAQEALQEMRLLLFELRPPVLEQEGLMVALQTRLEAVERRSGLVTELRVEGDEDYKLPAKVEDGLYRIAQEALNNALKHAQARQIQVYLYQSPEVAKLEIIDDGYGFDLATVREHAGLGLRNIEERSAQLGAQLTIRSHPNQGTKITVELKL
jgi:signal transduction histidine kinase